MSLQQEMEFAFGKMGMTPQDFYCMTPAEFYLASRGWIEKQWKRWEHTRFLSYVMASTVPRKKKLPKMERWMPLPTDKERIDLTNKRINSMLEKAKKA